MPRARFARFGLVALGIAALASAVTYGIARGMAVTQAEWAVYLVQGLGLDWNLPPKPKANDYIARLTWSTNIDFQATGTLPGSSEALSVHPDPVPGYVASQAPTAEAMYRVSTFQPGDYAFRLDLAGGDAVFKVGSNVFQVTQPREEFKWVDLSRVPLDAGDHTLSLLLSEGSRLRSLSIVPPCLRRIEPLGGWRPLEDLTFAEVAVTVAKALDLEKDLPTVGPELTLKGEEFEKIFVYPLDETAEASSGGPFWLETGRSLVTARGRLSIPESGVYRIKARYFSPKPVRWLTDGCLKVVTCSISPQRGVPWTEVVTLNLDAGEHELELTLAPQSAVDKVTYQRVDASIDEYIQVVADKGFKLGPANTTVRRQQAIAVARRLRHRFADLRQFRCDDTLIALEQQQVLIASSSSFEAIDPGAPDLPRVPSGLGPETSGLVPIVVGGEPPVASPILPEEPASP